MLKPLSYVATKVRIFVSGQGQFSCGHIALLRGDGEVDGTSFSWNRSISEARHKLCFNCAVALSIKCCFCGCPILPGNQVALCVPNSSMRPDATYVDKCGVACVGVEECNVFSHHGAAGRWAGIGLDLEITPFDD